LFKLATLSDDGKLLFQTVGATPWNNYLPITVCVNWTTNHVAKDDFSDWLK